MSRNVRIVVLGGEGVGKSTLVTALKTHRFLASVPKRVGHVTIASSENSEGVEATVLDGSGEVSAAYLAEAHAVVLVCDASTPVVCGEVAEAWLRRCAESAPDAPVVVVGNKSDLRVAAPAACAAETIAELLRAFPQVVAYAECSAATLFGVGEVFYLAQAAVVHPIAPLYCGANDELRPKCVAALRLCFEEFDEDQDGILNDAELARLHRVCFGAGQLSSLELSRLRQLAEAEAELDATRQSGVYARPAQDGVTPEGFLGIMRLSIARAQPQIPWRVLRACGRDGMLGVQPVRALDAQKPSKGPRSRLKTLTVVLVSCGLALLVLCRLRRKGAVPPAPPRADARRA